MRLTVAADTPTSAAICLPVWRCRRKTSTAAHVAGGVWLGNERGLEERSRNPSTPSARNRSTHLATVFAVVLNRTAAAVFVRPSSITLRSIASRPFGVRGAFSWVSIRFSPQNLKLQQPQLPRSGPNGQPPESSQLEHDPEKWVPVFPRDKRGTRLRGDHAQIKKIERDDDSSSRSRRDVELFAQLGIRVEAHAAIEIAHQPFAQIDDLCPASPFMAKFEVPVLASLQR